jgi:hypothetical protein
MRRLRRLLLAGLLVLGCSDDTPAPPDGGQQGDGGSDARDVPAAMTDGPTADTPVPDLAAERPVDARDAGDAALGDAAPDASAPDGAAGVGILLPGLVCNGMPSECPNTRPENNSACSKATLCCVYQHPGGVVGGCTCYLGRWVCLDQQCGCPGGP